jgi:hypothetical protein
MPEAAGPAEGKLTALGACGAPLTALAGSGVPLANLDDLWSRMPPDDELKQALVVSLDAFAGPLAITTISATDRYANLEVNYLLQRVESFGGVVILTTNLDTSIDPALRRRLASRIVFATPEIDERERLWEAMLDTNAPVAQPRPAWARRGVR